jgi:hypothetical protein
MNRALALQLNYRGSFDGAAFVIVVERGGLSRGWQLQQRR